MVSQSREVVEDEGNFFKVRGALDLRHRGRVHVEAVAVGRCRGLGPRLALSPSVRVHHKVARKRAGSAPLVAFGLDALVAQVFRNALRWVIGVEPENILGDECRRLEIETPIYM